MADPNPDKDLERTSSQNSSSSRKSATIRNKPRKQSLVSTSSAKTLESFPSLSPEPSPSAKQALSLNKNAVTAAPSPDETPRRPKKTGPSIVDSLVVSTPSFRGRSALFNDAVSERKNDIPGALHHASDENIQRLIDKKGAVALVRQLASDLADRDAEVTLFRRKAEERERELKRMLREVEVSNMDIEKRLHRLEGPEDQIPSDDSSTKAKFKTVGSKERLGKSVGDVNGLDEMMGEAMKDDMGFTDINEGYLDSLEGNDKKATEHARSILSKESDSKSFASSIDSQGRPTGTVRGWKDYLWSDNATNSKTSRASSVTDYQGEDMASTVKDRRISGVKGSRKGLSSSLFNPPNSNPQNGTPTRLSRKPSYSVATWTMKLFAGTSQGEGTKRGRAASAGAQSQPSPDQVPPVPPIPQSAKAALMKVNSLDTTRPPKAIPSRMNLANATAKSNVQSGANSTPLSPSTVGEASNLGPVEMDTIHPPDSKPPTLAQLNDKTRISNDLLTDRFGFIYDQRRRKREAEASIRHQRVKSNASSNLEMVVGIREALRPKENDRESPQSRSDSTKRPETPLSTEEQTGERPLKKWQDYLKVATFPTELLSHTPTVQPTTTVISSDVPKSPARPSLATVASRPSLPSISLNPEPEMSPVTAGKAEIAHSSKVTPDSQPSHNVGENDPVKSLLAQLTELHDALQREKTIKWNEFLRKVRAERKREGENAATTESRSKQAAMPEVTLADGEMIGVAGLGNKGKVGRAKWKEFKLLVLGGIPVAYRAKIWAECSGASALRVPGYYEDLVSDSDHGDPTVLAQIEMDIHRTLTDNVFFRKGPGVSKLNEVLLAYARRNPDVGYCQGMNMIAASLLLIMPTAEDAFWLLTSLIENILPQHYYDHSLLASRADQQVLRQYVSEILPKLSAHLDDLGIELEALTFQWFLSVFTDCLSAEALFRVWDVVLCFNDGSTFLFQVALALLKLNEAQLLECDTPALVYGYIGNEMTDHAISIDGLIGASEALKKMVTRAEVEERRWTAVEEQRSRERDRERGRRRRGGSVSTTVATGSSNEDDLDVQEPKPFDG